MDESTREGVTWVLGTLISLCVLAGLAVRFVLLPWLRDHLTGPVRDVQRQVSENHHKHTPPTLPDRIDSLSTDVNSLTRVLEGHMATGDRWLEHIENGMSRLNARVAAAEARIATMLERHHDGPAPPRDSGT